MGNVEVPLAGDTLSGTTASVGGWAFSSSPIAQIIVFVDGLLMGPSQYGTNRPDIPKAFPGEIDPNVGYFSSFDTTKLANGLHTLVVQAIDSNGNVTIFPTVPFVVSN
jgi:N-acetylmuramoyl-L-alanine amidase